MELAETSAPGAIRRAGWRTPGTGRASDRHQTARTGLDRMPMTAHPAGARDDELDRSRNTTARPHSRLRPLDGDLPTGRAMSSTTKS
jgi:hypothetical protein